MRCVCFVLLLAAGSAQAGPEASEVKVSHHRHGWIDSGSGTIVASGEGVSRVLTNFHVCPDPGDRIVVAHQGKEYTAELIAWNRGLDLACVEVKGELPAVTIAKAVPEPGETVYQWGHAGGSEAAIPKQGRAVGVRGRRDIPDGGQVYETTIRAVEGDSGCGVFNAVGELVGVCWGRHSDYSGQACVRLQDVRQFFRMKP